MVVHSIMNASPHVRLLAQSATKIALLMPRPKIHRLYSSVANSSLFLSFFTMKRQTTKAIANDKEVVRVTFRLHGPELDQIRDVRDMLSLNAELDAARYLMQRGLEAMSATLASRKATKNMAAQVTTDAIVQAMVAAGFTPEEAKK